jgi:hypothetical protein
MPFDPTQFAAAYVLGELHSENAPAAAADALEAGYDGPLLRRLAGLERPSGWEIDQILPRVLFELNAKQPSTEQAALVLAKARARRILDSRENPLDSTSYFHHLLVKSDYAPELQNLAYVDEILIGETDEEIRTEAMLYVEELLDLELAARRQQERLEVQQELRRRMLEDWPFVVDSPTGRVVFRTRLRETLMEKSRVLWFFVPAALLLGWITGWWKGVLLYCSFLPIFAIAANAFAIRNAMKRECQATRWRQRVDL